MKAPTTTPSPSFSASRRLVGSLLCATAMATPYQTAFSSDEVTDEDKILGIEDIVITASRIKKSGFDAPTPVTMLNADDLNCGGLSGHKPEL